VAKKINQVRMKVILFFSRFTFICNIAFLLFVFFNWMERRKPVKTGSDIVIPIPFLKDLIVTLGFAAIAINLAMNIVYLVCFLSGKAKLLPRWLVAVNALFLLIQFYYFFLFKY